MSQIYRKISVILCLAMLLSGCVVNQVGQSNKPGDQAVLRVGISANAPPLVYKAGSKLQGLEIDFAGQLAAHLGMQVKFVELPWSKQLTSLEEGRIDIIMAGMTVTPKRSYRVSFAKPYLKSGQILLVRMKQANRFSSGIYSLMGNRYTIATISGTTGDFFITKTINGAKIVRYKTSKEAVKGLIAGTVDAVVHDAPVICYYAAAHEADKLTPILQMATEEHLAWAVNKVDSALLEKVNGFVDEINADGRLQATIKRWIPYL